MPETALTSALNATTITGDGNEQILQNDMGNTLIKDSITGSIMAINDGFIPLGMKEHGGILYIASYNPETNEGELGSIPSPIIHYTIEGKTTTAQSAMKISDLEESEESTITEFADYSNIPIEKLPEIENGKGRLNTDTIYILSDKILHCGDQFMVQLDLDGLRDSNNEINVIDRRINTIKRRIVRKLIPPAQYGGKDIYPYVTTQYTNTSESSSGVRGIFKVELYAVLSTGKQVRLDNIDTLPQRYYDIQGAPHTNEYWFLEKHQEVDDLRSKTAGMFRSYPNIPSGRLAIKFSVEYPDDLQFLYNSSYKANLPQIYTREVLNQTTGEKEYRRFVIVHGFQFTGDCPVRPDMIKLVCNDGRIAVHSKNMTQNQSDVPEDTILVKQLKEDTTFNIATYPVNNQSLELPSNSNRWIGGDGISHLSASDGCGLIDKIDDTYIISKFSKLNELTTSVFYSLNDQSSDGFAPIYNYSDTDTDGLFYIELDSYNTDIEFTVYLYTSLENNKPTEYNVNNVPVDSNKYVLYKIQKFPSFNPATLALGSGKISVDYTTRQFYQFKKGDYDIKLFPKSLSDQSKRKCFLYKAIEDVIDGATQQGEYIILEYDDTTNKYIKFLTDSDKNNGYQDNPDKYHTLEEFNQLQSWILPQYYVRPKQEGSNTQYAQIESTYRSLWPKYVWCLYPEGLPDQSGGTKYKSNWFVTTSNVPKIMFNGGWRERLMPVHRPESFYTLIGNTSLMSAFKGQRNALKKATDHKIGQFTFDDLKSYCLCKTNLFGTKYRLTPSTSNGEIENLIFGKGNGGTDGFDYLTRYNELLGISLGVPLGDSINYGFYSNQGNIQGISLDWCKYTNRFEKYYYDTGGGENIPDGENARYQDYNICNKNSINGSYSFGAGTKSPASDVYYIGTQTKENCSNPGFLTEAWKVCPGLIAPGPTTANKSRTTNILSVSPFEYSYGIQYLYTTGTSLTFDNEGGSGLICNGFGVPYWSAFHFALWKPDKWSVQIKQTTTDGGSDEESPLYHISSPYIIPKIDSHILGISNDSVIDVPIKCGEYTINVNVTSSITTNQLQPAMDSAISDNYAVIASPQLFINANQSSGINRTYKSDYLLAPVIPLGSAENILGLWYGDNGEDVIPQESNVISKNYLLYPNSSTSYSSIKDLLSTEAQQYIMNPTKSGTCKNTFENYDGLTNESVSTSSTDDSDRFNIDYIRCEKQQTITNERSDTLQRRDGQIGAFPGIQIQPVTPTRTTRNSYSFPLNSTNLDLEYDSSSNNLFVFCISYNESAEDTKIKVDFKAEKGNESKLLTHTLTGRAHFVPFWMPQDWKLSQVSFTVTPGSDADCWISSCGIYKVDTENTDLKWNKNIVDYLESYNNDKTIPFFFNESETEIYDNIIFPGKLYFEELQVDQEGAITNVGCLDEKYDGFQALPKDAYYECIGTYVIKDDVNAYVNYTSNRGDSSTLKNFFTTIGVHDCNCVIRKQQ